MRENLATFSSGERHKQLKGRTLAPHIVMKRTAVILALFLAAVTAAGESFAQTTTDESKPLVDAARDAKARRKTSKTRVITNEDVKKAKGKLIELPASKTAAPEAKPVDPLGPLARHETVLRERRAAREKLAAAEAVLSAAEVDLVRAEQAYFDVNDPNYRDTVLTKRFESAKAARDKALAERDAARVAAEAFDAPAETGALVILKPDTHE